MAEKSYEKIPSQDERHERQYNQRPIAKAVDFRRGIATHEEDAKDTIAPRVHGSSIGPTAYSNMPGRFSLEDDALIKEGKQRRLTFTTDDIEYAKRYQEAELRVLCCMRERRSRLGRSSQDARRAKILGRHLGVAGDRQAADLLQGAFHFPANHAPRARSTMGQRLRQV